MAEKQRAVERGRFGDRRAAMAAGALIILGYLSYGLPDAMLIQPLVTAEEPLVVIAANGTQLTTAALMMLINSAAVIGIGLFLYPILKRHSESIALGYVVTRTFESIVMAIGLIGMLALVPLSRTAVQSGAGDAATMEALFVLVVQGNTMAYHVAMIGLSVGSMPFCLLLFRSRLVPRVIPVVGFVGYLSLAMMMTVEAVGIGFGPVLYALYVPGMVFEIGLACWLLARGFDVSEESAALDGRPVD